MADQDAEYVWHTVEVPVVLTFEIQCLERSLETMTEQALESLHSEVAGASVHHGGYVYKLTGWRHSDGQDTC